MELSILFAAACGLFGSGCDLPLPEVRYAPQAELQEMICPRACPGLEFYGVWNDDTATLYLIEGYSGPLFDSIVVHEFIHYLQFMRGVIDGVPMGKCERERQAYALQDRYLVRQRGQMVTPRPRLC